MPLFIWAKQNPVGGAIWIFNAIEQQSVLDLLCICIVFFACFSWMSFFIVYKSDTPILMQLLIDKRFLYWRTFRWGKKVYVQNQSEPSNNILRLFCLTRGPHSPVRIIAQVQWFVYQNWLEPSGDIYYLYKRNWLLWPHVNGKYRG